MEGEWVKDRRDKGMLVIILQIFLSKIKNKSFKNQFQEKFQKSVVSVW